MQCWRAKWKTLSCPKLNKMTAKAVYLDFWIKLWHLGRRETLRSLTTWILTLAPLSLLKTSTVLLENWTLKSQRLTINSKKWFVTKPMPQRQHVSNLMLSTRKAPVWSTESEVLKRLRPALNLWSKQAVQRFESSILPRRTWPSPSQRLNA